MTAISYINWQRHVCYLGLIRTNSIRAEFEIIPNANKTTMAQPDYRVLTQGMEIGVG